VNKYGITIQAYYIKIMLEEGKKWTLKNMPTN
jgi:hypothetical protein